MKGTVLTVLCAVALSQGAILNRNNVNTICAAEDSESTLVAHENCNEFYICSGGAAVAIKCPVGLLYDPDTKACQWPESVSCGDRIIPDNDSNEGTEWTPVEGAGNSDPSQAPAICAAEGSNNVLIAHETCNMFYQCWGGVPVAQSCPSGTLFNPLKDYCDFPKNVECGDRTTSNSNTNQNGNNNNYHNPEDRPVGSNNDDPSQAVAICAAEDSESLLVAHENCNQFYKCNYGKPIPKRCPAGLLFEPKTDRCEWAEEVECGNRVIPDPDESISEWDPNQGAGNDDPSQAAAICAAEGSDHVLIAHEICNNFYQCWAGLPVALKCPPGLLFNPFKDYCDFPDTVDCGDRIIIEVEDDGNTGNNVSDEVPVGDNNDDPSQAPAICAADDSEGVLVAHENCNQFYKCSGGKPVALRCPSGLLFDPRTDRCGWANEVVCGNRIIPDTDDEEVWQPTPGGGNDDPSQAAAICAAEGSDHILIAHEICNNFYQCWAGLPVALRCPSGLLFNPSTDFCDFPANVDCGDRIVSDAEDDTNQNENDNNIVADEVPVGNNNDDPSQAASICAAEESDSILVAHENCNQFYTCNGGKAVALRCPAGLLFNPKIDRCDWATEVVCGDRIIPDPESEENNNGGGGSVWEPTPGGGNDDPSQAPAICAAEGSDNVMIAHENCNQYYQCWAGRPVALACPAGLFFNPYKDYCDFASNVDCSTRIVG